MKKTLLSFCLLYFFIVRLEAQPSIMSNIYYGYYAVMQDSAYRLSCGLTTTIKPGYLSFGYNQAISTSTVSWFCSKNFMVTGYGGSFMWKGYEMFESNNCSGGLSKVNNCNGITAVEVRGLNNERYAIAGTYDRAVFYTTIDSLGAVLSSISYPFPVSGNSGFPKPSKPTIIKSDIPNQYYICGSFENGMYILNIDNMGNILWSSFYEAANGIMPKAIMMDPYNQHDLVVVGGIRSHHNNMDAFMMKVDGGNGYAGPLHKYGTNTAEDEFRSIEKASYVSSNNGQGYVISGLTKEPNGLSRGTAWILKLDPNGNIIWDHVLIPATGTNKGAVDVIERLNTFNNYEYYVLIECSAGMQVAKLDDTGLPFQFFNPSGPMNEFVYNYGTNVCKPLKLGYVNVPTPGNYTGIQVYGTMFGYLIYMNQNASCVISAYFNGETNCFGSKTKLSGYAEGPADLGETNVMIHDSFNPCTNFVVTDGYNGMIWSYACGNVIPSGSNLRTAANGEPLKLVEEEEKIVGVFPNPVTEKASVTYKSDDLSKVQIRLFDVTGKLILSLEPDAKLAGTYTEEIDFADLNIDSGIYFLTSSVDGKLSKEKIVYHK